MPLSCSLKAQGWLTAKASTSSLPGSPDTRCEVSRSGPSAALPHEEDHCLLTSLRRRGGEAWAGLGSQEDPVSECGRKMMEKSTARRAAWAQPQGMARAQKGGHRAEGLGSQAKPAVPTGLDFQGAGFTGSPWWRRSCQSSAEPLHHQGIANPSCLFSSLIHSTPALRSALSFPRLLPVQTPLTAHTSQPSPPLPASLSSPSWTALVFPLKITDILPLLLL